MLTEKELETPAHLAFGPPAGQPGEPVWSEGLDFASLREAIHVAMSEEPPPGRAPYLRLEGGRVLGPAELEPIWSSLQGP